MLYKSRRLCSQIAFQVSWSFDIKDTKTTNWKGGILRVSLVQLLSRVRLFATPWTTACQASRSITNSQSPPRPMSIELMMPSNHLILCRPLLLLPSIFPSIRVFSNESALYIRWPKFWSFSFNLSPSTEDPGLISFRRTESSLYEKNFEEMQAVAAWLYTRAGHINVYLYVWSWSKMCNFL